MATRSASATSAGARISDFLRFLRSSPSPFHAVHQCRVRLAEHGFKELKERDSWKLTSGGRYYFTRNQSSIVAFVVGGHFRPGNGVSIVAAHTDSPCLKVKPVSKREKNGYIQVGAQLYGGGLWHTWFDRDLGLAGRVLVENEDGTYTHHLVQVDKPILRVPSLAIHLERGANDAFKFNAETHLTPILSLVNQKLNATAEKSATSTTPVSEAARHSSVLVNLLAKQLDVDAAQLRDMELCLYDVQPATLGGAEDELVLSARLDNLYMSYCAIEGLIDSIDFPGGVEADENIRLVALFDNEEVGSKSAYGADSALLESTLRRLQAGGHETAFEESVQKSYMVSADMAHAVHPNYAEKHEENHRPQMNRGVVIKRNANQRYATTSVTGLVLRELARKHDIPLQEFVVRNDSPCGSTIGPLLSAKLGLRTIDVGCPQLAMHSIRETGGAHDVKHAVCLFDVFFNNFAKLDQSIQVD
ncbi:peptidase M18 [Thamnocephalis sphaerospora]|uniref:aspartyl aminopeptidase n=1 Tax=Thamnocephalis sphaerospora TaxID=78915 RepID=A0A4P9XW90_9FUNG|nr:peptidase M18 [Thamnocephalis sphaerospora]|eukprot:RKP10574.1 peptidase M18 [Thamnocephalis sphaerospora]